MFPLPPWMRVALYATAAMNVVAAGVFLPVAKPIRDWVGLPELGHPLYATTVAMFIFLFGLAYLWTAIAGRTDRVFLALAAGGKLSFFVILVSFWALGSLPLRAMNEPIIGTDEDQWTS